MHVKKMKLALLSLLAIFFAAGFWTALSKEVQWQLIPWGNQKYAASKGTLNEYRLTHVYAIPELLQNLSGLAFDPVRQHLWAVSNNPTELFALSLKGEIINRFALEGFHDTEGVAYFSEDQLVIIEERRMSLLIVDIPHETGPILRKNSHVLGIGLHHDQQVNNAGLEGVTYEPATDRLFLVQENKPTRLYTVGGLSQSLQGKQLGIHLEINHQFIDEKVNLKDLASLSHNPHNDHLFMLSDESRVLVELTSKGELVGVFPLVAGFADLEEDIPQAEGISFDSDGNLYIVSEPNLFYIFSKP